MPQWLKSFVENDFPTLPPSSFPPPDLLPTVLSLYFPHMNSHYPVLHAPTFTAAVAAGEHLRNGGFGATVLLACAIGARFTRGDDSDLARVLLEGEEHYHSAGWRWFLVVVGVRRMSFAPAKIYDLQIYAVRIVLFPSPLLPFSFSFPFPAGLPREAPKLTTWRCSRGCSSWRCSCKGRPRPNRRGRSSARASGWRSTSARTARRCTRPRRLSTRSCGGARSGASPPYLPPLIPPVRHTSRPHSLCTALFAPPPVPLSLPTARILTFMCCRTLVLLEWMIGYGLGRPSSIHDEEYVPNTPPLVFMMLLRTRTMQLRHRAADGVRRRVLANPRRGTAVQAATGQAVQGDCVRVYAPAEPDPRLCDADDRE